MINILDNEIFREMFRGGHQNLMLNKDYVDSLNVFPVPDGDTGTNMGLTMKTVIKAMEAEKSPEFSDLCKALSYGAINGARGNSGVILSQIIKGITDVLMESQPLNTKTFAKAIINGANKAYRAVTRPKEGTILTVIRVIGENAVKIASRNNDFIVFFKKIIEKGEQILKETPKMLPVLEKAGVVDSGGQGLMFILIGMYNKLANIEMTPFEEEQKVSAGASTIALFDTEEHDLENIEFAYCTEFFIINLKNHITTAHIDKLRLNLTKIGDCVLVVGDLNLVKVHVHTNQPNKALSYALDMGELDRPKIENMLQQHRELVARREAERKEVGLLAISCGEGFSELFKDFRADRVLEGGQTMNPSVDDIVKVVNSINANNVIVLPNNKNIVLACEQAKELVKANLVVVATVNIPQGVAAAMNYEPDENLERLVDIMTEASHSVDCIEVTKAVRNTELDGFKLSVGDYIGISKKIIAKSDSVEGAVMDALQSKDADEICTITLYYGADVTSEQAEEMQSKVQQEYADCDVSIIKGGQPHYYYMISIE